MGEADDVRAGQRERLSATRSSAEPPAGASSTEPSSPVVSPTSLSARDAADPGAAQSPTPARTVDVPLRRLGPWLFGFGRRNPDARMRAISDDADEAALHRWELLAADGHRAVIEVPHWLAPTVRQQLRYADALAGEKCEHLPDADAFAGEKCEDLPERVVLAGEMRQGLVEPVAMAGESRADPLEWTALAGDLREGLPERVALAGAHAAEESTFAVLVIRRAGYAAAVFRGDQRVWGKVGRRHVHGRTAAGGWSQQRYARRRAQQADEIVGALAATFAEGVGPHTAQLGALVTGGDRALLSQVRALLARTDRRLGERLAQLPEVRLAFGTPSAQDLAAIPDRVLAVRIHLTGTPEPGGSDD